MRRLRPALVLSDAQLLAYAIMPNHLHLVVRQGDRPLARLMQPLLRQIAVLVQRRRRVEGHVFERRYRDQPCLTPEHVRNAIVYTHLNPIRAGLAVDLDEYPWTSHGLYSGHRPAWQDDDLVAVGPGLALFSASRRSGPRALRRSYERYLEWRLALDAHVQEPDRETRGVTQPVAPPLLDRGATWAGSYAPLFATRPVSRHSSSHFSSTDGRADLATIARRTLAECPDRIPLDLVRSNSKRRTVVRLRRRMIPRMSDAGYANRAIARYLRVSDQCVSRILTAHRRRHGAEL